MLSLVGLYTSPHLVSVRERIQIDGKPISEEDFTRFFFEVWDRLDPERPLPMFFKMLTLVAYHAFISLGVNATILEVGIGGRYDTTNVVPKPIVTGITALGLDHTAILGKTLSEIAWQKAGIFKVRAFARSSIIPNKLLGGCSSFYCFSTSRGVGGDQGGG
jgi:folylpolyglutamate synthase